jgi:hypothetical protein
MSGEVKGDRSKAVKEFHDLLRAHANYEQLRGKFMPDLKVQ